MIKKFLRYICLKFGLITLDKKFLIDICLKLGLDVDGDTFIMTNYNGGNAVVYINCKDGELKILK